MIFKIIYLEIQYGYLKLILFFLSFFFMYLPSPNLGLTPPGLITHMPVGLDAYRGSNCLWTRTLDRCTRVGLPECVVSTMTGPPQETAQDKTQDNGHSPNPRIGIKIPDPAGNRTRVAGLEGRDSTDHATATYTVRFLCFLRRNRGNLYATCPLVCPLALSARTPAHRRL